MVAPPEQDRPEHGFLLARGNSINLLDPFLDMRKYTVAGASFSVSSSMISKSLRFPIALLRMQRHKDISNAPQIYSPDAGSDA